jgi:hypothetical protein
MKGSYGDPLVEGLRDALTKQRENVRPDDPGEAEARIADFLRLDVARQRVLRLASYILRCL